MGYEFDPQYARVRIGSLSERPAILIPIYSTRTNMINDEEIDAALLANISIQWRKVSFVVGTTMMQINREKRVGLDDRYFASRVGVLVERGQVESKGDLEHMRQCEVKRPDN